MREQEPGSESDRGPGGGTKADLGSALMALVWSRAGVRGCDTFTDIFIRRWFGSAQVMNQVMLGRTGNSGHAHGTKCRRCETVLGPLRELLWT